MDGSDGFTTILMELVHLKIVKIVNFMLCIFYQNKKWDKKWQGEKSY